jgi:hypothetical protein
MRSAWQAVSPNRAGIHSSKTLSLIGFLSALVVKNFDILNGEISFHPFQQVIIGFPVSNNP